MARKPVVGADRDNWGGILNEFLDIEHGDGGYHNISYGNTASRPTSPEDGQIYINTQLTIIEHYISATWTEVLTTFPSGTKMIFYQGSAPTGWTKDTADNDKALRVVSGSGGVTSGTNSFSSVLTSAITTDTEASHSHSTPNHTHPLADGATVPTVDVSATFVTRSGGALKTLEAGVSTIARVNDTTTSSGSGTSGTGSTHSHTKTFDIDYMDVILCTKD